MSASERKIAALEAERDEAQQKVHELRYLLKQSMRQGEELEWEAIVNSDGVPLVTIRWDDIGAQVPAGEARAMALDLLRVCEWSETDAKLLGVMREAGLDERLIGGMLTMLREGRGGSADAAAATSGPARDSISRPGAKST